MITVRCLRPLLLPLLCLLPLSLSAEEKGQRGCRVLFLGASDRDPEKLYLYDGAKALQIDLPRLNLSKRYRLPAGALTLKLLSTSATDTVPLGAPAVTVGEDVGDFYLLVSPDPANKAVPVRMQVIDANVERFKPGQMLWYNLTALDIAGRVGSRKLAIKARSKLILDPPADKQESYPVDLSYRIAGKEGSYPLCETQWNHDPAVRTVLFIVAEAGNRTPRVVGFPDHATDPKDEEEPR